jgi:hypothetical protein
MRIVQRVWREYADKDREEEGSEGVMGKKIRNRWFWLSFYARSPDADRGKRGRQPFWSWCTGETMDEPTRYTICCLVEDVTDDTAAWKLVRSWFRVGEVRFCEERERGYNPNLGGRFPGYVPPPVSQ